MTKTIVINEEAIGGGVAFSGSWLLNDLVVKRREEDVLLTRVFFDESIWVFLHIGQSLRA